QSRAVAQPDAYQTAIPRQNIAVSVARSLLDRGRYDDAVDEAKLGRRTWHGGVPLAFVGEGLVQARLGRPDGEALLEQAWDAIAAVPEGWRHGQIRAALAEAA